MEILRFSMDPAALVPLGSGEIPPNPFMHFALQDLAVFIGFFVIVIGLSVWKSRKAKGHEEDSSGLLLGWTRADVAADRNFHRSG